jgi:hypothetical protein
MGQIIDSEAFRTNPAIRRQALFYARTGDVLRGPIWRALTERRERNPERFDRLHPEIAGYFTRPAVLGMQPQGRILNDLRRRYEIDPDRFTYYHPFWGRIFDFEPSLSPPLPPAVIPPVCPPVHPGGYTSPPPTHPTAVPEADSLVLFAIAVFAIFVAFFAARAFFWRVR